MGGCLVGLRWVEVDIKGVKGWEINVTPEERVRFTINSNMQQVQKSLCSLFMSSQFFIHRLTDHRFCRSCGHLSYNTLNYCIITC